MTNSHNTESYSSLSIQVRLDGLSFFTQNPESREIGVYDVIGFRQNVKPSELVHFIEDAFQNHPALSKNFEKVTIVYDNELYAVIPSQLFDRNHVSDYLKFSTKILSTDFVAYDELPVQNKVVVYIPYTNVNNYFFDRFGSFEYFHSATLFLNYTFDALKTKSNPRAFALVKNTSLHLALTKNSELLLFNTFKISSPEDFLYYLLFAYEQLGLDTNETPLELLGDIQTESDIYVAAYKYVRHCTITKSSAAAIQDEDALLATLV